MKTSSTLIGTQTQRIAVVRMINKFESTTIKVIRAIRNAKDTNEITAIQNKFFGMCDTMIENLETNGFHNHVAIVNTNKKIITNKINEKVAA